MNNVMRLLAPKTGIGFLARFTVFVSFVGANNFLFDRALNRQVTHDVFYYLAHAFFVGGPIIVLFLVLMLFQIKLQQRLWRQSCKDDLTGLNNRHSFFRLLAEHAHQPGILMMLDADHFKQINDRYGHQAGDQCLKAIAHCLNHSIRQNDIAARIGGEEFAVFLPHATQGTAKVIGNRLTRPIPFSGGTEHPHLTITLSVGAVASTDIREIDKILAQADAALYQAKSAGRARMVLWDLLDQHSKSFVDRRKSLSVSG